MGDIMGGLPRLPWQAGCLIVVAVALIAIGPLSAQEAADAAAASSSSEGGMLAFIGHFLKSLGIPGIVVLGALSICMVALIVMLMLDLRSSAVIPAGFVEEFVDTVNKRQFKQAFDLAAANPSFLGRVLAAGMRRLQYGLEDAREAAVNTLDTIKSGKDQLNSYLAVIGTIGPLLGLVGTVFGMIKAFMALNKPDASIDPKLLAEGISHALCMTLAGVGLAVPAIFFNAFFKNRIMHVSMDCGNTADDLLTQMYHNSKKAAPPVTPTMPPTGPATPNGPAAPVSGSQPKPA
jgi:biopolymer transport protein ExbB